MKQLILLEKTTNINFDLIISDIFKGEYLKYDYKELTGYKDLHRIRIGGYRIIFQIKNDEIKILMIGTRGDVYKKLKQMFN